MKNIIIIIFGLASVSFLGSLFVYKSYLMAKSNYEVALEGNQPIGKTCMILLVKGGLFLFFTLILIFYTVIVHDDLWTLVLLLLPIALCGMNAYWGISYGCLLLRHQKKS